MNTTARDALLPCPFCGKQAASMKIGTHWHVECSGDWCGTRNANNFGALDEGSAITAWNHRTALSAQPAAGVQGEAVDYARRLAVALHRNHYAGVAPHWQPYDDLMGLLSQIDNMICGLKNAPAAPQRPTVSREALVKALNDNHSPDMSFADITEAALRALGIEVTND